MNLLRELADALANGHAVVCATVVDTSRSVPRKPGARMLVYADGRSSGTIGGGEMEARVRAEAADALVDHRPRLLNYQLVDPGQGDPGVCGGDVQIFVEPHMPQPTIIIMGYGHVGQAVAKLASWLDYRVVACDDRAEIKDASDTEHVDDFIVGSVDELLDGRTLNADTSVVMVTRNVAVDVAALPGLLATDVGYVGVMGSQRRWKTSCDQLEDAGVDSGALDRVKAPIGIEVGAETPEEIAVSIMAEVIAHRRG